MEGIHELAGDGQAAAKRGGAASRSAISSPSRTQPAGADGEDALRARLLDAAVELLADPSVPRLGWTGVTGLLA